MWSSTKEAGVTLIELLVSLMIITILASVAIPYAEVSVRRDKEIALHRALRDMRSALDAFHADWREGGLPADLSEVSTNGYPARLSVLTDGIRLGDGNLRRYLRRIPRNPFASAELPVEQQWHHRGYEQEIDERIWNEIDVYDVRVDSDGVALDGTHYREW